MTGRRIVSIWLPQFPMERWQKAQMREGAAPPDDLPVVLAAEGPHGPVVHAMNRAARLAGVQRGGRVVDMRAFCPALQVDYADPEGDRAALDRLGFWARRWCPWSVVDGADGLILDTTGADHLWGGEAALLAVIEAELAALGFAARLAMAPSWGAAWALARFGGERAISHGAGDLAGLPVVALRLDPEVVLLLQRLGIKTVGALADLPRLSLARRFARAALPANPLLRLDQAVGRLAEPLSCPGEPAVFRAAARLAEPILDPLHFLPGLCDDLCAALAAAGMGCRRLRLSLFRTDGALRDEVMATATASRDAAHLARLFQTHLLDGRAGRIDPGFGFDLIALEALAVEPLAPAQAGLEGGTDEALELARLIDRLGARFGARAVGRPVAQESHIPERAERRGEAMAAPSPVPPSPGPLSSGPVPLALADRPLRLLDPAEEIRVLYAVPEGPPAQFLWRRRTHRVTRYAGPERIAPEWWHDRPGTRLRDYFKVEDAAGGRFWLYREGLHEDGRGGDPRWLLHGIFA